MFPQRWIIIKSCSASLQNTRQVAIVKKIAMDSDLSSGKHCLTFVGPEPPVVMLNQPNISFGAHSRTESDVTGNILCSNNKWRNTL